MEKIELEEKMMDIGIPTGLKGFDYTVEYILLSESGRFGDHPKVTALYAFVGKKFGVPDWKVERDIRYLVNACKRELDPEKFTYYFGTSPTNGNAVDRLKRRIKIELERQVEK